MAKFRDQMERVQLEWRRRRLPQVLGNGRWRQIEYEHILPRKYRQENLWPGIQKGKQFPLEDYLNPPSSGPNVETKPIQAHPGRDNLLSSWTLAANLYFAFGQSEEGRRLIASFLSSAVDDSIASVSSVELEWEHKDEALKPRALLGEKDGSRGSNQTSPDLGFDVTLKGGGSGVVLTEVKFTEHNFYACSIRKDLAEADRMSCHDVATLRRDPARLCGQHTVKGRRYWDHLKGVFDWGAPLRSCPAATAGYQLFRQQALAEALAAGRRST